MVKRVNLGLLIAILLLIPLFIKGPYYLHILILIAMNIMLASSFRIIAISGQISLAHGSMMAIGAYTSALLVTKLNFSFWISLPLAGLASAILALLVGYSFIRLKGVFFVMVTAFLAQFIILIIEQWRSLTGGSSGIIDIPRPNPIIIPGLLNIDFSSKAEFYYLILVLMLITLFILNNFDRSRIGSTWQSIRQSDSLAESVCINTTKFKVLAFCIGCFFAGITGSFYSSYIGILFPTNFTFVFAIYIVVYATVGGMRQFCGPILGAFVLTIIPELARASAEYQPILYAIVLMLIVAFMPEGLAGLPIRLQKFWEQRRRHA